ncbi:MAG: 6-pyruvoyl-tetrahydropterin synthase-related protein [Patescibacteria group bacterium]
MKSFKHYILVIAISALPFLSIFATPLAPHTHDSPVHYARMAAYYKALSEGQILPRWAGELNYGYGMPLFNFIYHVPYLVTSLVIALGGGLVFSFKISMLVSFLLSGIFMYMFALRFFKHEGKAFITTVLYQFAPFHLVDLVVRGDIAEGYALAFLPLVLFGLQRGFEEKNTRYNILLTGFAVTLLITSHNAISLVFFTVAVLYSVVFAPDNRKLFVAWAGLGLGLMLSAFYWLPALIERKYTYGDLFMKEMYASHFAPFFNFLLPNLTNSEAMQTGGITVSFGLVQVIAFITAIVLLTRTYIRDEREKKAVAFGLFLTLGALFLMQPVSKFLWAGIPILRMFQFPWRLLNVVVFALAFVGGAVLVKKKTTILTTGIIAAAAILSVIVFFRPPLGMDTIDEKYFWDYPLNTTYFGETDVIWSAGPAGAYPVSQFEVIEGRGTISDGQKKGTTHTFTVTAETDVNVVDRTQYFPGWRVTSDGQKIPIQFQDQNWRGLITFRVPSGTHSIRVMWGESPVRRVAEAITALSLIGIGILLLSPNRRKK